MATIRKREGKRGLSYQIRVSCGYDIHGKQVSRSMTWRPAPGMTKKQMEKEVKRKALLFDEQCAAQGQGDGSIKFEAFARQWFTEYAEPNLRTQTIDLYHFAETRVYAAIGHIRLDKLTTRHVQSLVNSLGREGQSKSTGGKLSAGTIRYHVAFISSVLDYAVKMDMLQDNPCRRVSLPPVESKEKEVYTLEEALHFLESLETAPLRYQAFFTLAIFGGFRRGELLGLEWADIDFSAQLVTIRRTSQYTKDRGVFTDTTKTKGSQRTLKLPEAVFAVLKRHRADQAQQRLLMGDRWTAENRLFTNDNGGPLHPNVPYTWLKKFCKKTGQRFLGLHMFRHLNASLMIGSGVDVRTVSAMLGHSNASTTLDIYAHSFEEVQARASDMLENLLKTSKREAG